MTLTKFIEESNRIEGILRPPTDREIAAHENFLALDEITIPDLERFVSYVQPGAELRSKRGMDVRVGNHYPPPGGPNVVERLYRQLVQLNDFSAYDIHIAYEMLHPFTDGNGRSGRALWLWMMGGDAPLGFLHHFYYQTLEAAS